MTQSEKKSICIILGTAHGYEVAGKCSPDGKFKEYEWSREICNKLCKELQDDGYRCIIDYTGQNEIGLSNRCQIVNNYCNYFGSSKCVYVSIHVNAAGADGKWHTATGWESHVAKNASEKSKRVADIMWEEFSKLDIKMRRPTKTQNYWQNNFTVLVKTKCPAVLTENMFQDNKDDVEYLTSKKGKEELIAAHKNAIESYVDELIVK